MDDHLDGWEAEIARLEKALTEATARAEKALATARGDLALQKIATEEAEARATLQRERAETEYDDLRVLLDGANKRMAWVSDAIHRRELSMLARADKTVYKVMLLREQRDEFQAERDVAVERAVKAEVERDRLAAVVEAVREWLEYNESLNAPQVAFDKLRALLAAPQKEEVEAT